MLIVGTTGKPATGNVIEIEIGGLPKGSRTSRGTPPIEAAASYQ